MHSRGAPQNCERPHTENCQENKDKHFRTPRAPLAPQRTEKKKAFPPAKYMGLTWERVGW